MSQPIVECVEGVNAGLGVPDCIQYPPHPCDGAVTATLVLVLLFVLLVLWWWNREGLL